MTEKQLNQIYHLQKEKKIWENKLAEMTEIKAMSYENTGAGHSSDISSPVVRFTEQQEKIRAIISTKLEEIALAEQEILEYINGIDDSLITGRQACLPLKAADAGTVFMCSAETVLLTLRYARDFQRS